MKKILLSIVLILTGSAIGVIVLSDIPFGFLFNTLVHISTVSVISLFFVSGYNCIKNKNRSLTILGYFCLSTGLLVTIGAVTFIVDYRILLNTQTKRTITKAEWIEDLTYFTEKMETIHPDLFSLVSEKRFRDAVDTLKAAIPNIDDNKIKAEFCKILALPNDAHTIPNIQSLNLDWHMYPLNLFYFDNGIYVIDAGRGFKDLIGCKLLKIGAHEAESVFNRIKVYLGSENEIYSKNMLATILLSEWLLAEEIITETANVPFTFQDNRDHLTEVQLNPIHYLRYFYWSLIRKVDNRQHPITSNDRKQKYWYEYHPASKSIFFQFNECQFDDNYPLETFLSQLKSDVETHSIDKFIVDIRNNGGGRVDMLNPIADFIINDNKINQKGKLFVLISRKTFSAAVLFASILERNTKCIFVGEPTAQAPFQRGGGLPQTVILPNSGLQYNISSRFVRAGYEIDKRVWIAPDISLNNTIEDFLANRDIVLEGALNYKYNADSLDFVIPEKAHRLMGRYLFSPHQILTIKEIENVVRLEITDFLENSLQYTRSDLYQQSKDLFVTDIRNVYFTVFAEDEGNIDSLELNWNNSAKVIHRVADDFYLPMELFARGDIEQAVEEALNDKSYFANQSPNMESYFNQLGYKLLNEGKTNLAVKVFALNVELYPSSANTYDSLGEAYLKLGDNGQAIKYYRKSAELNPKNENAKRVILELEQN